MLGVAVVLALLDHDVIVGEIVDVLVLSDMEEDVAVVAPVPQPEPQPCHWGAL